MIIALIQRLFDAEARGLLFSPWFYLGGAASVSVWYWVARAVL